MSWFASSAPTGPNIHPVQLSIPDTQAAFGPLTPQDNEWLLPSGIATETQTFYATLKDGSLLMAQVIHSSIGCVPRLPPSPSLSLPSHPFPSEPQHLQGCSPSSRGAQYQRDLCASFDHPY